jgi:hypothetical protein
MTRFVVYVALAFVTTLIAVAWAVSGFPMQTARLQIVVQLPAPIGTSYGGELAKELQRKAWVATHTAQSDKNPKLDALRLDALQAATAYKMSPCDSTMKQNLVDALTAYTRAYVVKLDCPRRTEAFAACNEQKIKDAADTFSTPLDTRVRAALFNAFREKGIVRADFPADLRQDVLQFAGPGLLFNESPVCLMRQRHAGVDQR